MPAPEFLLITQPETSPDEIPDIIRMFKSGLTVLHLRKPGDSREKFRHFLESIPKSRHGRIVLHDHYELTAEFALKGVHFPEKMRKTYGKELGKVVSGYREKGFSVSTSFHSVGDIRSCAERLFDYAFLSPVFDSISKPGYRGQHFGLSEEKLPFPVIALGGITPRHIPVLREKGFSGGAFLGYVWDSDDPVKAFTEVVSNFWFLSARLSGRQGVEGQGVKAK